MKQNFTSFFQLLAAILVFSVANAQDGPLVLSWDKLGCQQDTINKINFSESADIPCLKVCKNAIVTYRISGEGIGEVDYVKWRPIGGQKVDDKDLFAMPIIWDNETTGSLRITVVFLNGQTIVKTICINKLSSSLIFGWDKIGCQMNKNNTSEIKLADVDDSNCLRVCEKSKMTYRIFGEQEENITSVSWGITGGQSDDVVQERDLSRTIVWDTIPTGSIRVLINFNDNTTVEKAICIQKISPSFLLDWEKIDESAVRQIKFDNPDNPETIMAYPESTVMYRLSGDQIKNIDTVTWNITGGYAYYPNQFSAIITWEEAEEHAIEITIVNKDSSSITRKITIVKKDTNGGPGALNAVQFTYDNAGNQIRRHFIYLARQKGPKDDSDETSMQLLKSEYDDITYFPNPVKSELFVSWKTINNEVVQKLELYDLNGRKLKDFPNQDANKNITISFEEYPSGIYELQLTYNTGEKKTLKIVRQ